MCGVLSAGIGCQVDHKPHWCSAANFRFIFASFLNKARATKSVNGYVFKAIEANQVLCILGDRISQLFNSCMKRKLPKPKAVPLPH
jgi:hypothetical protein